MTNEEIKEELIFRRREQILKNYGIKLTYRNNSSFIYVQYQSLNLPMSYYFYKGKNDDEFLIKVLMEFKGYNYYPKIEMSNTDLKRKIHRNKLLLEDYYIIPVYTLNDNSNFKLRKLQVGGNIEILYPYDDFCNKSDLSLIDDILDKFKNNEKYRDLRPITPYKPKVISPIVHNSGINFLTKIEKVNIPLVNIEEKKNNIRSKLIERGFICQI